MPAHFTAFVVDKLSNDNPSKAVNLKITPSQFSDLIQSLFDYTICLAEANNISPTLISKPKILKKKTIPIYNTI